MKVTICYRKENKNFDANKIYSENIDVDMEFETNGACLTDLDVILNYIWENRLASRGTHRSGIFQVQTNAGIWEHINEKKIDVKKPQLLQFISWERYDEIYSILA